ncbi:MAG: acyl-CoA reductase, partial [Bacteroidetes bacterium]|nr:acyl-CoA reductase [Bacteroidota bacterium]
MQALLERLHRLLLSYQNPQPEVDKNHNIGLQFAASRQVMNNPWFTEKSVKMAIGGIAHALEPSKVEKWLSDYEIPVRNPKNIGVVMAGNVPLVGFHDFLSVLVAGHNLIAKTSSDDNDLLPVIGRIMTDYEPQLKNRIMFTDDRLMGFDAVIATGSNNTSRYFKHYFGKYPHIIRKSRNSLAVLTGTETPDELSGLCRDIFSYYGLGCRNISKLYVPENWDTACIIPHTEKWMDYTDHHKY